MVIKPPRLHSGDTVGVIAPSGPVRVKRLQRGIRYLRSRGFKVRLGNHIYNNAGYLAGYDEERAQDIIVMFSDPEVKAIFMARGGYGTLRLLHLIDYKQIKNNPKVFVGYSDATALQLAILRCARLVTFSGPMVAADFGEESVNSSTESHFWSILQKHNNAKRLHIFNDEQLTVLHPGVARGTLICGCLSVIIGCLGTRYCPDFKGAILVLEDIGEEPYKLDRAINTLRHHDVFKKIRGLVLGKFVKCDAAKKREKHITIEEIVKPIVDEFKIPTLVNLSYGHIPEKLTLPIGIPAQIDGNDKKFELVEDAVS